MKDRVGIPYESGIPGIKELATSFNEQAFSNTPELFCGEVDILQLQQDGRVCAGLQANKMPPYHFAPGGRIAQHCMVRLGPMIKIKG